MSAWTNIFDATTGQLLAEEYCDDKPQAGETIEVKGKRLKITESKLINPRTYDWSGIIPEIRVTEEATP